MNIRAKKTTLRRFFATLVMIPMILISCGSEKQKRTISTSANANDYDLAKSGQEIFSNRNFGKIKVACMDCHADHDDKLQIDSRLLPGHSILGAARREETWNGEFKGESLTRTGAGAAKCVVLYQQRSENIATALTSEESRALLSFFATISVGNEPTTLPWNAVTYSGDPNFSQETFDKEIASITALHGEAERGEALFRRACLNCHTVAGNSIGPNLKAIKKRADRIPAYVRAGNNVMPFFSRDKLSDKDIADIIGFVEKI